MSLEDIGPVFLSRDCQERLDIHKVITTCYKVAVGKYYVGPVGSLLQPCSCWAFNECFSFNYSFTSSYASHGWFNMQDVSPFVLKETDPMSKWDLCLLEMGLAHIDNFSLGCRELTRADEYKRRYYTPPNVLTLNTPHIIKGVQDAELIGSACYMALSSYFDTFYQYVGIPVPVQIAIMVLHKEGFRVLDIVKSAHILSARGLRVEFLEQNGEYPHTSEDDDVLWLPKNSADRTFSLLRVIRPERHSTNKRGERTYR